MADLRALLEGLGHGDVRTLLQSGNAVLTTDAPPERVGPEIEQAIDAQLGLDVKVVMRTRDELAAVVERDPLGAVATDPTRYRLSFMSEEPERDTIRGLAALDIAPERFAHHGREIYSWHPDGFQGSELLKVMTERRLGVTATARNWKTVTKLLALADE
jgi:uncharacterized protein (DUF1697 family)